MIKELRIGNLVGTFKPHKVNAIYLSHFTATDENGLEQNSVQYNLLPIPLTPEILEKAGFVQHHDDCSLQPIYIKKIFGNTPFVWGVYPEVLGSGIVINDAMQLQSLHQLQNLYFALTGEELNIQL